MYDLLGEHFATIIYSYIFTLFLLITIIVESYLKSRKIRKILEEQINEKELSLKNEKI